MQRSSTLITPHYSPSIPPHYCPRDSSSDPLRLRERSRHSHSATSLVHRQFCDQRIKQPFTPPSACTVFFVLPLGSSPRQPPTASHQLHHLWSPVTPESKVFITPNHPLLTFPPTKPQSLQPHCRQQQPPSFPFAPDYQSKFSYCAQSCGICHTTLFHPQSPIFTARFFAKSTVLAPVSVQTMLFPPWNPSFAT